MFRSAALAIAYLMKSNGLTLLDAYAVVKRHRPCIRPNNGNELMNQSYSTPYAHTDIHTQIHAETLRYIYICARAHTLFNKGEEVVIYKSYFYSLFSLYMMFDVFFGLLCCI